MASAPTTIWSACGTGNKLLLMPKLTPTAVGALLLSILALPGAAMLLVAPPPETTGPVAALILLAVTAASGAVGGYTFARLAPFRARNMETAQWWMSAFTAGIAMLLVGQLVIPALGLSVGGSIMAGTRGLVIFMASVILFGSILADVTRRAAGVPRGDMYGLSPSAFRVGTLILVVMVMAGAINSSAESVIPYTEDDAARMLTDAEKEARDAPASHHAQLRYGITLGLLDRYDEALASLNTAARLDSTDAHTRSALGWTLMQMRRYEEALPHLEVAAARWPDDPNMLYNLGWTLLCLGRFPESQEKYERLLRLDSLNGSAHADFAWALHQQNKDSAAVLHVLRALELKPELDEVHAFASVLLRERAQFAEARKHLEMAARLRPERADYWGQLGVTHYLMQDAPAARMAFAEAHRRDSTYFARHPFESAMRNEAARGRTGDVFPKLAGEPARTSP